jgi:O-antigen ligase
MRRGRAGEECAVSAAWTLPELHRQRLSDAADYLAVALVVSLPWSTSATGILAVLWLIALLPTLDLASARRVVATPAGGLPVLLVALAALGMLWADVAWSERFEGFVSYLKLAVIPLLFIQFRRSERGPWAIYALLAASTVLLATSYVVVYLPDLWPLPQKDYGVVVKDYISQSGFFTICVFVLIEMAYGNWQRGRRVLALAIGVLTALFLIDIFLIVTSRTTLLVIPALILLYGFRRAGWRGMLAACLAGAVMVAVAWSSSPNLRDRVRSTLAKHLVTNGVVEPSSTALRFAFWKSAIEIAAQAPIVGHGIGSIRSLYQSYGASHADRTIEHASNPHNQTLAVAIQLGLVGTLVLYAMWLFHFLLFRGGSLAAWFGMVLVVQNFVSSLANTHLFDFTQGWTYAVLVGVAGGTVLRQAAAADPAHPAKSRGLAGSAGTQSNGGAPV